MPANLPPQGFSLIFLIPSFIVLYFYTVSDYSNHCFDLAPGYSYSTLPRSRISHAGHRHHHVFLRRIFIVESRFAFSVGI